jgi:hypothetical protein
MNDTVKGFLGRARQLEASLTARVEGASRRVAGSAARQPLEIILAVVDAVEREVQPSGRGGRALPFNNVLVQLTAASPKAQAQLEVLCDGPPSLQTRIMERLQAARCACEALPVTVSFAAERQPDWSHDDFDLRCTRSRAAFALAADPPRVELTVTHGTAERTVYVFDAAPIALGRGDEVRDGRQRLLRTNQVAFTEGAGDVNQTVSRRHARIEHDAKLDGYRLYDDGSAQGTSVIRKGLGVPVPHGARGLRLQSGDELVLGQARIKVKIGAQGVTAADRSASF